MRGEAKRKRAHDAAPAAHLVVVGHGMVAHRFVERLVALGAHDGRRITVCGEEPHPAYDRVNLTRYFEGKTAEDLRIASPGWYAQHGIDLRLGARIERIDREARVVTDASGAATPYDALVLATGSRPLVPPLPGIEHEGVFVYRVIEDLQAIARWASHARRAVVLGGGLLGLEAAKAVCDLGLETHVVELAPRLMPRQLDAAGGAVLARKIEALGVRVHVGQRASAILGDGRVRAIELSAGPLDVDLVVVSAGIVARDELARAAGIAVGERSGIVVDDALATSDPRVFAIGEAALHRGSVYGLVGPGYEMADVLARRFAGEDAHFTGADLSTKLKLLGVDVASFGDAFADERTGRSIAYVDYVRGVYKKLAVNEDATRLLGGVLVGDAAQYERLVDVTHTGAALPRVPESLLFEAPASGAGLSEGARVCSCNGVSKGAICDAIRSGATTAAAIRSCTRAGAGCGGCVPLVTDILAAELRATGKEVRPRVCEHFAYTRQELFQVVQVTGARTFEALLASHGAGNGCEICKPAVASILASLWNENILDHQTLQDTNDRFLANMQRGGLYSIVPRVPGGEITPDKLIALGTVAKKYGLYTKITGGQRIDLFGARVGQLPDIWEELVSAGFESGHAYGKAMRTVKSCVGTTWCRYGVQDSVAFSIRVEERYKGVRAPHKMKSAVSGCVRECAEAQSKDFGLVATEKGWNLYVCGNGGMKPRHADLLAADVDDDTAIRYLDRFVMFYIRTADRLTRTSVWLDKLDGGIEYLRDVIVNDRLGICAELERQMQHLVDTYQCEWAAAVRDPAQRARFRHFANEAAGDDTIEWVIERGQRRPKGWARDRSGAGGHEGEASARGNGDPHPGPLPEREGVSQRDGEGGAARRPRLPVLDTRWVPVATTGEVPRDGGIAVKYGEAQLAVFHFASRGEWYACQNMCPHKQDMVLARGIVGDQQGTPKVACPMHKKTFSLRDGACLSGDPLRVATFPVKVEGDRVLVELPPQEVVSASLRPSASRWCTEPCPEPAPTRATTTRVTTTETKPPHGAAPP
jgi:nitrite reductase (NADH) large subunit